MVSSVGAFRKSSYSQAESNCVEVAMAIDRDCAVRDSKRQDSPLLVVSSECWMAFLSQFAQPR
ncbi:DUF397 domain-containing protein [Streptomyces sp. NPDC058417]|uniref:DUF397 domain-containing protein n=1 Tax=unclassified Streptomyces TaxID=2593676 RepID=UPI003664C507